MALRCYWRSCCWWWYNHCCWCWSFLRCNCSMCVYLNWSTFNV